MNTILWIIIGLVVFYYALAIVAEFIKEIRKDDDGKSS